MYILHYYIDFSMFRTVRREPGYGEGGRQPPGLAEVRARRVLTLRLTTWQTPLVVQTRIADR